MQAAVHAALHEWTEALANGHDERPVTALYDKDAALLATFDPKPLETPSEIAAYFHKLTQNPELKATVQSEKIDLFGDAAVRTFDPLSTSSAICQLRSLPKPQTSTNQQSRISLLGQGRDMLC
jgi:hypothetical protein